jgi:hypothetical protein
MPVEVNHRFFSFPLRLNGGAAAVIVGDADLKERRYTLPSFAAFKDLQRWSGPSVPLMPSIRESLLRR